ncbi:MAG TPA: sulfite exporter TauE/SafE family protein [Candidatus Sulfotelmatobacter sp.]|nr:sulfite exporter TauE/SafE family protein [Candidatus Sulfotelmatobacter sp.]
MLPVGVAISALVMSAGVSGATLWFPVYLLWLKLDAPVAFWLGLFTMLFGFGSGMMRNFRDGTFDGAIVRRYLTVAMPAALLGGWASAAVNQALVVALFGAFLIVYAIVIGGRALGMRLEEASDRHDRVPFSIALVGGALTGLISIGIGILAMPSVLRHRSIRSPGAAIGSLVMIIFFTSLAATVGRMRPSLISELRRDSSQIVAIAIWAVPGVIVGGQIGPRLTRMLTSERHARMYFSAVLLVVGLLTLARAGAVR